MCSPVWLTSIYFKVNDVIVKVSHGKKPASIRSEGSLQLSDPTGGQNFLYELKVQLEVIDSVAKKICIFSFFSF